MRPACCSSLQYVPCRWALGIYGFKFPLLLTSCHMGFSFVALLPFMLREPFLSKHKDTLQKQWKGLVAIGLYMVSSALTEARHQSGQKLLTHTTAHPRCQATLDR